MSRSQWINWLLGGALVFWLVVEILLTQRWLKTLTCRPGPPEPYIETEAERFLRLREGLWNHIGHVIDCDENCCINGCRCQECVDGLAELDRRIKADQCLGAGI